MTSPKHLAMTGKALFAVPFIVFGVIHFTSAAQMAGAVPAYIPGGVFWVYVVGAVFILSALGVLTGKWAKECACALAVMLAILILFVQLPGALAGNQMSIGNLLKDTALLGGALLLSSIVSGEKKIEISVSAS